MMTNTEILSSKPKKSSSLPSRISSKRKRGMFDKDLRRIMYGYGDDSNPLPETVALVEDIVVEYVAGKAQNAASDRGKLLLEDFVFQIRKDSPKLNRCAELLAMHKEIKKVQSVDKDLKHAARNMEADEDELGSLD